MKLRRVLAVCALVIVCFVSLATPALASTGYIELGEDEMEYWYNPYPFEFSVMSYSDLSEDSHCYSVYSTFVESQFPRYRYLDENGVGIQSDYSFKKDTYDYDLQTSSSSSYADLFISNIECNSPVITYRDLFMSTYKTGSYDPFPVLYVDGVFSAHRNPDMCMDITYNVYTYFYDGSTDVITVTESYYMSPSVYDDYLYYDLNDLFFDQFGPNNSYSVSDIHVVEMSFYLDGVYDIDTDPYFYSFDVSLTVPLALNVNDFSHGSFDRFAPSLLVEEVVFNELDFVDWLSTAVGSFLEFELLPGLSLGVLFGSILGVTLLFAFIRFFT